MKVKSVKGAVSPTSTLPDGNTNEMAVLLETAINAIRQLSMKNLLKDRVDRDGILYRLRFEIHALDLRSSDGTETSTTPTSES